MDTVTSLPGVTEPGDFELIGFTGRQVVVAACDDRGLEVGRLIDARELFHSGLFERLSPREQRLVEHLIAASTGCLKRA